MELNPHHPIVEGLRGNWHKLVLLLIKKFDLGEVVITVADLDRIDARGLVIVAHEKGDGLHLRVVSVAEGERLAREHGGLPT